MLHASAWDPSGATLIQNNRPAENTTGSANENIRFHLLILRVCLRGRGIEFPDWTAGSN
jgi:hypothetical protein